MNRFVTIAAALLAFVPMLAHAQTTAPVYQGQDGQTKEAIGTFPVGGAASTGTSAQQSQGAAASGTAIGTAGNPQLVAGSDGTSVRTLRLNTSGAILIGDPATNTLLGTANTAGDNLSTTPAGLRVSSDIRIFDGSNLARLRDANTASGTTGTGIMASGLLAFDGTNYQRLATAGTITDATAAARHLATATWNFNGVNYDRSRGDTTGTYVVGNIASGATDAGNPVKIGGVVQSNPVVSPGTIADGNRANALLNPNGMQYVAAGDFGGGAGSDNRTALYGFSGRTGAQSIPTPVWTAGAMFNGAGWDRVRGDTTGGLYVQERERSQYGFDLPGVLAAGASYFGATRDGGASPSQWGTFSCFVRSDQASAAGGFGIQGSNDGTNWFVKVVASVSAATSVRVTDRNDTRYSRCVLTNGATANAVAPNMNYSFGN